MAKGPDPNRWSPSDPDAAEDDARSVHESLGSSGVRLVLLVDNGLLALVLIAVMT